MDLNAKIYVAGHNGLVGSALIKKLIQKGYKNLILKDRKELDLINQRAVKKFFLREQPEYVFLAAAKVGGIYANNQFRANFLYENLAIQNNVIHYCHKYRVKKLLFLGSSCIYPKKVIQPITECMLLTSSLEYTNEPYAIAKIAGIKLCESYNLQYSTNFICAMPCNLYGPYDNFDLDYSHVIPAIIRKMILAKWYFEGNFSAIQSDVKIPSKKGAISYLKDKGIHSDCLFLWGSGSPLREFLWSEDMADACVFIMENINFEDLYNSTDKEIKNTHINIGSGEEISIKNLAHLVKILVGYKGKVLFDISKPDGVIKKLLDSARLHKLGWKHKMDLRDGVENIVNIYLNKHKN